MAELSSQTLHIVARELNSELNDARTALEAFGEQQDNVALLRKCNEHLRSVHGALRIAEVYGAALLAEEMGQVARYLIDNFSERRHLAEGLDALMRAMVQLPTYLERVMSGGRDMALVLLPLLNDLRAVRRAPNADARNTCAAARCFPAARRTFRARHAPRSTRSQARARRYAGFAMKPRP